MLAQEPLLPELDLRFTHAFDVRINFATRWVIGPILYTGAALTGVSRMYNNRHWMSDVLVGAGVGTFAGLKVVRYQHSHPGNRIDRWLLKGSLSPAPGGGQALHWSIIPAPAAFTFTTPRR